MKNLERAKELVSQMTLEEKAGMCSGLDCWRTKPIERLGIPSIMVSDGPHGLRKQITAQDNLGIGESAPATCFPTASMVACSFDPDLAYEIGKAIGEECVEADVAVLLGPGINMKRSPLCGRNFEYYSEDPLVSAKMAIGMIKGVQSMGVGTSLKHFAVNNQERRRMNVSAVVDERTLHEIYLKAFQITVQEANPRTVMCSYNKINEVYASENKKLLTDLLRDRWKYDGLVVSDWGAVHNRVDGIEAGLDLEMPGSCGVNDRKIVEAVKAGKLSEELVDKAATNVVCLVLDSTLNSTVDRANIVKKQQIFDRNAHHKLAVRGARESMVLLRNEDHMLPIGKEKVAVIGAFATKPRYQGAGSSKINPIQVDYPLEMLRKEGIDVTYVEEDRNPQKYIENACKAAREKEKVIIFTGLPEKYESEGFDREDMCIPEFQNQLIEEVCRVNPNVIVVLMGGAPMELPWATKVKSILLCYLGGEGIGTAVAEIISGKESPSGKLAETWPLKTADIPCADNFPGDRLHVLYQEMIKVGYRYYDSYDIKVCYPFGHGLSYSSFQYKMLDNQQPMKCKFKDVIQVSFLVKNMGEIAAKETSFVFVSHENEYVFIPKHQLVGFTKELYQSQEEKMVTIEVNTRDFGYYHTGIKDYYAESGVYSLVIGSSLEQLPIRIDIELEAPQVEQDNQKESDFEVLLGHKLPKQAQKACRPYTADNCIEDVKDTFIGKILEKVALHVMKDGLSKEEEQQQMMNACMYEMPFFALQASSNGLLTENMLDGIIDMLNGHYAKGIKKLLFR